MIRRIAWSVLGALAAILLVTLAVANRHTVQMVLDPLNPENPALAARLPFYVYLFAMLVLGIVLGGLSTWTKQGKWRRKARDFAADADHWKREAARLSRERDAGVRAEGNGTGTGKPTGKTLALARR